ncbi:MAG: CbtA family protein, partial [Thermoproteota archaeon]|nr:CbtA family protein [Thermoproteota archaeon]
MKALTLVGITLSSGVIAGIILAFLNLGIVEPTIDKAIALEVQKQVSSGENVNMSELIDYRYWQKAGAFAGGAIYGAGLASLFGVVFVFARSKLPGKNNKQKAILLAGIMWLVLFLMVALKYPANPPAVGDPETLYYRETLYVGYILISGLAALGMAVIWIRTRMNSKKIIIPLMYAAIMVTAYVVMPSNPDKIEISMDLIQTFRILTAITI